MTATKCWKWTWGNRKTYTDTLWGEGVERSVPKWTGLLCTDGVIHAYQDPWLAVLMAPAHGYDYEDSIFWEAEAGGRLVVAPDKIGCETLKTIRQVEPPAVTVDQRVEIAIRCAMAVLPDHECMRAWREWAERWLSGEDRSHESANTTAIDTVRTAARIITAYAVDVAYAAARAAAATDAAGAAHTTYAADAAYAVARAAAARAIYAAITDHDLEVIAIIRQVCGAEKEGGTAAMIPMKCWKWTRNDYRTYSDMLWGEGVEHSVPEWTGMLCTRGVIHAYQDPRLAVLVGPIYGYDPKNCLLWEAEARGRLVIESDMIGCETLRTVRQVESPVITMDQRVEIAIRCAMAVLPDNEWAQTWRAWAEKWLSGEDRSHESANTTAIDTARITAYAIDAAYAAARAAADTDAANTAYTTANAAVSTAIADHDLDIIDIIRQVCGAEKKEVQS